MERLSGGGFGAARKMLVSSKRLSSWPVQSPERFGPGLLALAVADVFSRTAMKPVPKTFDDDAGAHFEILDPHQHLRIDQRIGASRPRSWANST
jgi:hypothetical protein